MKIAQVVCALLFVACGKSENKREEPVAKPNELAGSATTAGSAAGAPDPQCAAKVKDLEPWLISLQLESSSYEIDFGYKLQKIDRAPSPVEQQIDNVMITEKRIDAFDATESNHAESKLGEKPAQKDVAERLALIHGMTNDAPDQLRIDVDEKAPWSDVVRVVDAATKAGYTEAVFAFTGTSKLAVPAGVDEWTKKSEDVDAASKKLEEMRKQCKEWGSALFSHVPKSTRIENATSTAKEIAAAIEKCGCVVNVDDVRAQMFKETRWHQAVPRVGVLVKLGAGGTAVTAPAKTAWSEAHAKLLEAAAVGAPAPTVKLAAK
jgi:hypothetical protein